MSFVPEAVVVAAADYAAEARPRLGDERLPGRTMAGDEALLRSLYERHVRGIQRFLRDLIGDPTAAADATQETFARAFRALDRLHDAERTAPWLFGIARNVALEHRKAARRASARFVATGAPVEVPDELTPERVLIGRQTELAVARALQRLSEGRRMALLLRVDHRLSYDEIAAVMGVSLAKVKIDVFRARQTVREELSKQEGDGR